MNRAFLADAGEHVLQRPAVGRVIENRAGGNEGNVGACRDLCERCNAGAIVAAIRMLCCEIERRARWKRVFDAVELCFEIWHMSPLTPSLSPQGRGSRWRCGRVSPLPIGERVRVRGKRNDIWKWGRLPIIGRERDEDQAFGVVRDVIEKQRALTFLGAALAEGEEPAKPAIGGAVGRVGEQAGRLSLI